MADEFTYWLEYLFMSPEEDDWVTSFHHLLDQWRFEDCRRFITAAKRRAEDKPHWVKRIKSCEGRYFLQNGQWDRAEVVYREALDAFGDEEAEEIYEIVSDLGLIQRLHGELKKAIHNHQLCLNLAVQNQWVDAAAESHIQLGLDYEITGELSRAEFHHLDAERLYQQLKDDIQLALTRKSRALILIRLQQFARAQELLINALPVLEAVDEPLHVAQAYGNLGNIAACTYDYQQAKDYYALALERFRSLGAVLEICGILNNLASLAYFEGNFGVARTYYEESLIRSRELGSRNDERNALSNISLVYLHQAEYEASAQACWNALRLSRQLGDRQTVLKLLWRQVRLGLLLLLLLLKRYL